MKKIEVFSDNPALDIQPVVTLEKTRAVAEVSK
jgi:hypothetical protein